MTKPWLWNLILLAAVAVAGARMISALGQDLPALPSEPKIPWEAERYPRPPEAPEAAAYRAIAERNLFSPDRGKPEPEPVVKAEATPPPSVPPPKVTLFGIVIEHDGRKYAFLRDDAGGAREKPKKLGEGDAFSGGRIKEIRPDQVILSVGKEEHTFALRSPKKGLAPLPSTPSAPKVQIPQTDPDGRVRRQPAVRRRTSRPPPSVEGRRRPTLPARRTRSPNFQGDRTEDYEYPLDNDYGDVWGGDEVPSREEDPWYREGDYPRGEEKFLDRGRQDTW